MDWDDLEKAWGGGGTEAPAAPSGTSYSDDPWKALEEAWAPKREEPADDDVYSRVKRFGQRKVADLQEGARQNRAEDADLGRENTKFKEVFGTSGEVKQAAYKHLEQFKGKDEQTSLAADLVERAMAEFPSLDDAPPDVRQNVRAAQQLLQSKGLGTAPPERSLRRSASYAEQRVAQEQNQLARKLGMQPVMDEEAPYSKRDEAAAFGKLFGEWTARTKLNEIRNQERVEDWALQQMTGPVAASAKAKIAAASAREMEYRRTGQADPFGRDYLASRGMTEEDLRGKTPEEMTAFHQARRQWEAGNAGLKPTDYESIGRDFAKQFGDLGYQFKKENFEQLGKALEPGAMLTEATTFFRANGSRADTEKWGLRGIKSIPVTGTTLEAMDFKTLRESAKRFERGEADERDAMFLARSIVEAEEAEKEGNWEKVGKIAMSIPGFAAEYAVTGGAFTFAKGGTQMVLNRMTAAFAKQVANRTLRQVAVTGGRAATAAISTAAGLAAHTLANPHQIIKNTYAKAYQQDQDFLEALPRGIGATVIELGSERLGGLFGKIPVPVRLQALRHGLEALERNGIHSPWGESLEERAGEIVGGLTGVENNYGATGQLLDPQRRAQGLNQIAVEMAAFLIPSAASAGQAGIQAGAQALQQRRAIQQELAAVLNATAMRIEQADAARAESNARIQAETEAALMAENQPAPTARQRGESPEATLTPEDIDRMEYIQPHELAQLAEKRALLGGDMLDAAAESYGRQQQTILGGNIRGEATPTALGDSTPEQGQGGTRVDAPWLREAQAKARESQPTIDYIARAAGLPEGRSTSEEATITPTQVAQTSAEAELIGQRAGAERRRKLGGRERLRATGSETMVEWADTQAVAQAPATQPVAQTTPVPAQVRRLRRKPAGQQGLPRQPEEQQPAGQQFASYGGEGSQSASKSGLTEKRIVQHEAPMKLQDRIMEAARKIPVDRSGYVPVWKLRELFPDVSRHEFDEAIRRGVPAKAVIPISDLREMSREQLQNSVEGVHETLAYLEPAAFGEGSQTRQDAPGSPISAQAGSQPSVSTQTPAPVARKLGGRKAKPVSPRAAQAFVARQEEITPIAAKAAKRVARKHGLDAGDLEQDILLKVSQNMDAFDEKKGNLEAFVNKIANTVGLDAGRKKGRQVKTQPLEEWGSFVAGESAAVPLPTVALIAAGQGQQGLAAKYLTAKGHLSPEMFAAKIKADGRIAAYTQDIKNTTKDLRAAITEAYKVPHYQLPKEELAKINASLKGQEVDLPPAVQEVVDAMREQIDLLSHRLTASGAIEGDLVGVVDANIGTYLNRGYQVFEDPEWAHKVDPDVRNRFKSWLRKEFEQRPFTTAAKFQGGPQVQTGQEAPAPTDEELEDAIDSLLVNNKAADTPISMLARSKLGGKLLSILKRRKELPEELRALWGEYNDPLINYTRTVGKMAHLLSQHMFLKEVREAGLGTYFFEKPTGAAIVQIDPTDHPALKPLGGLYTTPEIKTAFQEMYAKTDIPTWLRWYMRAVGLTKYSKTVLSHTTHIRNFLSNSGFAIANGHWRVKKASQAYQAFRDDTPEGRAYHRRLLELGLIGQSIRANELRDIVNDAFNERDTALGESIEDAMADRRIRALKAGKEAIEKLYELEDSTWKVYAFENEKARYRQAHPEWSEKQLEEHAAEIVRNTYPTYSMLSRALKNIRRVPVIGPFLSFPAEVVRTTYHTLKLAKKELSTPGERKIGAERLAGATLAAAMLPAIAMLVRALVGVDGDEEKAGRRFLAPWSANSLLLWLGLDGKGGGRFLDLGYSDPHAYLRKMVIAAMRGEGWEDKLWKFGGAAAEPFVSPDILGGKIMEWAMNKHMGGRGTIYNEHAPASERAEKFVAHFWDAFQPGSITSAARLYKAVTGHTEPTGRTYNFMDELLANVTGQRIQSIDVEQGMGFKALKFMDAKQGAQRNLTDVINRKGMVSDREIQKANASMESFRRSAFDELRADVLAALKLGVTDAKIREKLKGAKVNVEDMNAIMSGKYSEFKMADATERSIFRRADDDKEAARRMKVAREAGQKNKPD